MTPELTLLVWAVALTFVQMIVAGIGANLQFGVATTGGNRETMPAPTGWAGRASRAHRNMLENLPLFAALVLVAVIAGRTNATTLLGAQIFLAARVLHGIVYVIGIPVLRSVIFAVSVIGMGLIFLQLL